MFGVREEGHHVGLLDDLTGVHDGDPIRHLGHHSQIVGDEDHGRVGVPLQIAHEVQDLRLDRDVQRRRRLVRDQQLGLTGQGHRDHDSLRHATGEFVGVRLHAFLGIGNANPCEYLDGRLLPGGLFHVAMDLEHLGYLRAHAKHGVERRLRLLEDHRDLISPDSLKVLLGHLEQVLAVEGHRTGLDPAGLRHQSHDRKRGDAFATTRLPDDGEHLAATASLHS